MNKNSRCILLARAATLWLLPILLFLSACQKEPIEVDPDFNRDEIRVAIILPQGDGMQKRWVQTAQWAMQNLDVAQNGFPKRIKVTCEWYDEDAVDIEQTVKSLVERDEIAAIIGPMYSSNTLIAAKQCAMSEKTLITTTASSAELVRSATGKRFLWALTETDISQCEVMLSKALIDGAKKVSLLAKDDMYGQTFIDWFAFQAKEFGLEVGGISVYSDGNIEQSYNSCVAGRADYIICVPSSVANLEAMLKAKMGAKGLNPRLLFSDVAYSSAALEKLPALAEGMEGIAMSADPASGFAAAYQEKFKEEPFLGGAQLYDAITMVAYGSLLKQKNNLKSLNQALCQLVDGRDANSGSWHSDDMRAVFGALNDGGSPDISGASGSLNFDATVYTNVLYSIYAHWKVENGKFSIIEYTTSDADNRTDATLGGWNWKNDASQNFDKNLPSLTYPELDKKWALIVAASSGWSNYRHQGDALQIYQLLKSCGYPDERIVLIIEDDIAYNAKNPDQGVITSHISGENLHQNVEVDYKMSSLDPSDISKILAGQKSEKLRDVIEATKSDNVLVFWSGHGLPGQLVWNEDKSFTPEMMNYTMDKLSKEKRYRKMLWLIETCFAGSVAREAVGFDGVMMVTASAENETSKADVFSDYLGVWTTNRFTTTLYEQLNADKNISLRELYIKLFRNTVGSHVTVYNNKQFDNLYTSTMQEFL